MPNIKLMESSLPVAPLKIAAHASCIDLGKKVNDYIVSFRQNTLTENHDFSFIPCSTVPTTI